MSIYDFAEDAPEQARRRRALVEEDISWSDAPDRSRSGGLGEVTVRRSSQPAARIIRSSSTRLDGSMRSEPTTRSRRGDGNGDIDYEWQSMTQGGARRGERRHTGAQARRDTGSAVVRYTDTRQPVPASRRHSGLVATVKRRRADALERADGSGSQVGRIALWAFLVTLVLFIGTAGSSHAAVLTHLAH